MTSWMQPADMGMIAALKAGYKFVMLNTYLSIFDLPGGYERAARERAKAGKGKGGLQFGGIQSCLFFQSCFQRQDSIILIFPQGPVGPWSELAQRLLLTSDIFCWFLATMAHTT